MMPTGALVRALALAAAAPSAASAQMLEDLPQRREGGRAAWNWAGELRQGTFVANFVRADVRIVRSRGERVEVFVRSPDPDGNGSPVTLLISRDDHGIRLIDRYPPSARLVSRECLPPDGEHGGQWIYSDRLDVVLGVPRGLDVSATVMDGTVTGG